MMFMNEAQQRERIAHGVGSLAFALDVLVLIALAKLVGPVSAILWIGLSVVGGICHYKTVKSLAITMSKSTKE